ncbi:MAG: NADH-quinone oxidoreductase subunit NuoK [Deltaproteobacteria bacterium]|nr:NADH-quinone oxidoreductase subunit NuoK [Deltaproteobacteria bacterium]
MAENLASGATGLHAWLLVTSALFSVGVYGLLTRRNAVGILLSLELCLNAAAVQFVVFNAVRAPARVDGAVMALFVVAVAAAEVVVAMAIFVLLYSRRRTVDVTDLTGDGPGHAGGAP